MSVSIVRLELGSFESLPQHTRRCVFWEVERPPTANRMRANSTRRPGSRGGYCSNGARADRLPSNRRPTTSSARRSTPRRTGCPPVRSTSPLPPVSHDAVLLTSIRTEPGHDEVATILLDAVLGDLIRRGVRAVESFGLVRNGAGAAEFCSPTGSATSGSTESGPASTGGALPPDLDFWTDEAIIEVAREILEDPQADLCTACMIDASFLKNSGFDVVSSHQRFPRFRLELDEGLGWKFEVESALEKLVVMAEIDLAGRQRTAVPVGVGYSAGQREAFSAARSSAKV